LSRLQLVQGCFSAAAVSGAQQQARRRARGCQRRWM